MGIFAMASAERKVPPRHPLQRLERLGDWYTFLPSQQNWINKFSKNAARMSKNFERGNQRCGFYDDQQRPHGGPRERRDADDDDLRYNREDPSIGTRQITTGFKKMGQTIFVRLLRTEKL